jgi:hypothetical protein
MNKDIERKLDQLLNDYPQPDYPLDEWLSEDETEEFDRIVRMQKRHKVMWRWVAIAACFMVAVGIGTTMLMKEVPLPVDSSMVAKNKTNPPTTIVESYEEFQPTIVEKKTVASKTKSKSTPKRRHVVRKETKVIQEKKIEEKPAPIEKSITNSALSEDPFAPALHFARDIRSSGERLERKIIQTVDMDMY